MQKSQLFVATSLSDLILQIIICPVQRLHFSRGVMLLSVQFLAHSGQKLLFLYAKLEKGYLPACVAI